MHFMKLHIEVAVFFMDHSNQLAKVLNDENLVWKLSYLINMFSKMNEKNLSSKGKSVAVFKAMAKYFLLSENLCIGWSVW